MTGQIFQHRSGERKTHRFTFQRLQHTYGHHDLKFKKNIASDPPTLSIMLDFGDCIVIRIAAAYCKYYDVTKIHTLRQQKVVALSFAKPSYFKILNTMDTVFRLFSVSRQ